MRSRLQYIDIYYSMYIDKYIEHIFSKLIISIFMLDIFIHI